MNILQVIAERPALQPDTIGTIGSFPITSSFTAITLITTLVILFIITLNKKMSLQKPGKLQAICEMLYEGMHALILQLTDSKKVTAKIFPLIAALFIFIGISNTISFIPGFGSILWDEVSIFRTPTSDFNTTFGLAVSMILLIQIQSLRDWGFFGYIGRFVQIKEVIQGFRKGIGEGMLSIIHFLIGLLDVVSELAKIISLSVRLFGNLFAGEMMAVLVMGAFAYGLPAVWSGVSLFTGAVQAIVFGSLVSVYYTLAMKET